ncbi:MAG: hypothetical protein IIA27_15320 [Gemmatimonadetes bacterium]|nr:hypothetical protein [Gemmatimonadota bacterium]
MKHAPHAAVLLVLVCILPTAALGQDPDPAAQSGEDEIQVFLDCQTFFCDFDHFRREIPFVSWVRDRQDADVHVLGTLQLTGGGGREHTFTLIGLREFAGRVDTLQYTSVNTDTSAEIRDGMVRVVKLGLVPFVATTSLWDLLDVTYRRPVIARPAAQDADPWNLWVFTLSVGGNFRGESERRSFSGNGSIRANRTAENVKIDLRLSGRASRAETDVPELDTTFVNTQERYDFNGLLVWSLSDHWSAGIRTSALHNNFVNQDLTITAAPTIEYNIFPYRESTRRQLTLRYSIGVSVFDYEEVTVFGRTSETRLTHRLEVGLATQQPWGSISASVTGFQFLHDLSKHRLSLFGGPRIRLFRGLNFNVFGSIARVKDQLFIAGADLTPEERLLRTRQFSTDFQYFVNLSFSYRFGSRFANIVNPRMGSSGGIIFF